MVVLLLAGSVSAQVFEGREIKRIEIETTPRLDPARIRQLMRTREGDIYRSRAIEEDIERLHREGRLVDVSIEPSQFEDGVKLIVRAKEPAVVTAVVFRGDLRVEKSDLLKRIQAVEGSYAYPYQLRLDAGAVKDYYREQGFAHADIRQELVAGPRGVEVVYTIDAGPRRRLESVQFEGNTAFDESELRKTLGAVSPRGIFTGGDFEEDMLRLDLDAVRQFYRGQGWLDATVGHRLRHDDTGQRLYLTISVREGPRYKVEAIHTRGNALFTRAEILDAIAQKAGGWYQPEQLEEDRRTVRDLYGEQGRLYATVQSRVIVDTEQHTARIHLDIEESHEVFVRQIRIHGNRRTQDRVIRRELEVHAGERVNTKSLDESVRHLKNTGLFQPKDPQRAAEPVRVRYQRTEDPQWADAVVEVEEGRLGDISLGFAFSSTEGLAGQFRIKHDNFDWADTPKSWRDLYSFDAFAGGAQELTLSLSPGQRVSDYRLAWQNPSVYDSVYSGGFDLYWRDDEFRRYMESRRGVRLNAGRRFFRDLQVTGGVTWEDIFIHDISEEAGNEVVADIREVRGHNEKRALSLRISYDKRDNFYWPSDGYRLDFQAELAGGALGGDVETVKEILNAHRYWTVWDQPKKGKHIFHLHGRLGFVQPTDFGGDVPIFERFFIGGLGSLRGFEYRGVGPVDDEFERHIGGKLYMVSNVEYYVPIKEDLLHMVGFVDAGKVDARASNLNLDQLRLSVGFGFRLRLPILASGQVPLIMDFGFPLLKEDTDNTSVFGFSMGTGFTF